MSAAEDLAAVEKVVAGDASAFEGIVHRWQGPLVNLVYRFCRDRSRAEEMAQEAFLRAYRSLDRWRREAAFSTFHFSSPSCYRPYFGGVYMSVNKVILVGRLGRDPETRFTSGGQAVANFSIATDETYKDKSVERQKRTEWHKIVVWGKQAEIAQQYLKKGSLVFIEGRIQSREWQDKEGQKRTSFEIVATNFRMLGGRSDGMAAGAGAGGGGGRSDDFDQGGHHDEPMGGGSGPEISDEDIPF